MDQILRGRPWTFDNQVLKLIKWKSGMSASNVKFDSVSLWIQIWGVPFDMASPTVAVELSNRLGVVEEVERRQKQKGLNFFMQVKVAIPIAKTIHRGVFLAGSDGQSTWDQV